MLAACLAIAISASISQTPAIPSVDERLRLVPDRILLGFTEPGASSAWETVNDGVMGGRSRGGPSFAEGRLTFSGVTNTNGGGFSSIRTRPRDWGLADAESLLLRVKGDGRTYIASLSTSALIGGFPVNYWARFATSPEGAWQTVRIPLRDFRPTFFGEDITGRAPEIDPAQVDTIGIFIYDKKDGPFRLDVEWIGMAGDEPGSTAQAADETPALTDMTAAAGLLEAAIERGVPRFNRGEADACADIYEVAILGLVRRPAGLPPHVLRALDEGLRRGAAATDPSSRAWAYRLAMDSALSQLSVEMNP
jgi:monofunctional biosynthetic peptidoglycan transglycosylase